jgi:hypothetical protein
MEKGEHGIPGFVQMWADLGGQEGHQRKMAWLTESLARPDHALDS